MHALITGGAGFIGSEIARILCARGDLVSIVDDLSTGSMKNVPAGAMIAHRPVCPGPYIDDCVRRAGIIFHLAAVVGVKRVLQMPVATIERNYVATQAVLAAAARFKKPVIIASSSEVYGRSLYQPLIESQDLRVGSEYRWGYAAGKILDEHLAMAYHKEAGLPVVVARLFNCIGPRQSGEYGMVVPRFIDAALSGSPIQVHGDGSARRSFNWVGDTARAMIDLVSCPGAHGQAVNIGSPDSISIGELAREIRRQCDSSSPIVLAPSSEALGATFEDIQHRTPDLTKIRSLIGYAPTMNLSEMITRIIQSRENGETYV